MLVMEDQDMRHILNNPNFDPNWRQLVNRIIYSLFRLDNLTRESIHLNYMVIFFCFYLVKIFFSIEFNVSIPRPRLFPRKGR